MSSIHDLHKRFRKLPKEVRQAILEDARARAYYNDGMVRVLAKQGLLIVIVVGVMALAAALALSLASRFLDLPFESMLSAALWTIVIGAAPYLWSISELWALNQYIRIPPHWQADSDATSRK